ncbi:MAG: hypothetical protein KC492_29125 [Myxococcales bacterium]|nr:hypothetical protein [Myxococcales bacterium]
MKQLFADGPASGVAADILVGAPSVAPLGGVPWNGRRRRSLAALLGLALALADARV